VAAPNQSHRFSLNALASGYYRDVTQELAKLGYRYDSNAKGSHERWLNAEGNTLIVPRNLRSRHTANGILKDAGSNKRF
jgi:predicted RNA binding protein YcfA (HicA-like mRNA interferase family)